MAKGLLNQMELPAVIGWREWVTFPELGIGQIKVKVDTGARTSALHAYRIQAFERGGQTWVRFDMHQDLQSQPAAVQCEAPVADQRVVRDSGGHEEMRYVIETAFVLGGQQHRCEVTLTDRDNMKFRALLGRSALRERYTVDPTRSYLMGKRVRKAGLSLAYPAQLPHD